MHARRARNFRVVSPYGVMWAIAFETEDKAWRRIARAPSNSPVPAHLILRLRKQGWQVRPQTENG